MPSNSFSFFHLKAKSPRLQAVSKAQDRRKIGHSPTNLKNSFDLLAAPLSRPRKLNLSETETPLESSSPVTADLKPPATQAINPA